LKFVIKKDLRALLPGFAMFVTGGIAMLIITAFALFSGNGNFAVTAMYIFLFAPAAVIIYVSVRGADVFRKNLLDLNYPDVFVQEGISVRRFVIYKLCEAFVMGAALLIEYVLFIAVSIFLAEKKFAGNSDMTGFLDRMKEGTGINFNPGTMFLVFLELVSVLFCVTALVFLAFSLCYKFFLRYKYAFGASILTSLTMFWVVWKIFDTIVPAKGMMSIVGTILFALLSGMVLSAVLVLLSDRLFERQ